MINFVNLMEGRSIGLEDKDPKMETYWNGDWYLEPTYQGKRFQCLITENEIKFQGKKLDYKDTVLNDKIPHIISDLKSLQLPSDTLLDGVFAFDNDDVINLYSFLSLKDISSVQKMYENLGLIKFYVTDIIYFEQKPIFSFPLFDRKKKLSNLICAKENIKLQNFYLSKKFDAYNELKNKFKMFVFKKIESVYKFGVSSNWLIFKMPISHFMIIIGFIENDREEFKHMVLALEGAQFVGGKLQKIMNIPVHGSENRLFLFQKRDELKGKVFEIKALEKKNGKYQEARFFSLRQDLKQESCIFEQEE